ncbi:hypothetical protein JDV02_010621 [Purpureocillium takamizusanense]|uniref:1-alkyl-2-acetylglycerophosphocholine esterase n=1 Tax=Purpureocillium takamizusanense TaxID=2060973 RepID=A0A9Q8VHK1_9HYPO|nr:uncharacterized protein JDV02_010621 [Purpureocillium takamizusanense]UNI24902.1 hypothetical protein JDV02_010621 [Purpureocillium takamizusanense]
MLLPFLIPLLGISSAVLLPPPPGPYPVALAIAPLTDPSRRDDGSALPPSSSSSSSSSSSGSPGHDVPRRRILASVFVPLRAPPTSSSSSSSADDDKGSNKVPPIRCPCRLQTLPYMTPAVAASYGAQAVQYGLPEDLYARFEMQTCDPGFIPAPQRCHLRHSRRHGRRSGKDDTPVRRDTSNGNDTAINGDRDGDDCKTPPVDSNTTSSSNNNNSDASGRGGGGRQAQLIVLTPGLGESRLLYSALARALASTAGLPVVLLDHPFEALPGVEFPDGSVVPGVDVSADDEPALGRLVRVRVDDISFLLKNIPMLLAALPPPLRQHLEHHHHDLLSRPQSQSHARAIVIGHSLGGSAAIAALAHDPAAVLAAINLDGRVVEPAREVAPLGERQQHDARAERSTEVKKTKMKKTEIKKTERTEQERKKMKKQCDGYRPLVQLGRPSHRVEDPTWDASWPYLNCNYNSSSSKSTSKSTSNSSSVQSSHNSSITRNNTSCGPVVEYSLANTTHAAFTDRPLLLRGAWASLTDAQRGMAAGLVGGMAARRLEEVLLRGVVGRVLEVARGDDYRREGGDDRGRCGGGGGGGGDGEVLLGEIGRAYHEVEVVRSRAL